MFITDKTNAVAVLFNLFKFRTLCKTDTFTNHFMMHVVFLSIFILVQMISICFKMISVFFFTTEHFLTYSAKYYSQIFRLNWAHSFNHFSVFNILLINCFLQGCMKIIFGYSMDLFLMVLIGFDTLQRE